MKGGKLRMPSGFIVVCYEFVVIGSVGVGSIVIGSGSVVVVVVGSGIIFDIIEAPVFPKYINDIFVCV